MKKLIVKLASLSVLITAGWVLYVDVPSEAATLSCWEQAYNKWMGCDGAYFNTKNLYQDRSTYCDNTAAQSCVISVGNTCNSAANTNCANDADPQVCAQLYYATCYAATYPSCHSSAEYSCLISVTNSYDNRGNAYSTCLGMEGNYGNCIEQPEFSCTDAQNRALSCASVYSGSDDGSAYWTCRANSGIDLCQ